MDFPYNDLKWKRYGRKEDVITAIESAAHDFFSLALTHRPAKDRPDHE